MCVPFAQWSACTHTRTRTHTRVCVSKPASTDHINSRALPAPVLCAHCTLLPWAQLPQQLLPPVTCACHACTRSPPTCCSTATARSSWPTLVGAVAGAFGGRVHCRGLFRGGSPGPHVCVFTQPAHSLRKHRIQLPDVCMRTCTRMHVVQACVNVWPGGKCHVTHAPTSVLPAGKEQRPPLCARRPGPLSFAAQRVRGQQPHPHRLRGHEVVSRA